MTDSRHSTRERARPLAWVTGAGGLIGSYLVNSCAGRTDWQVRGLTRQDLDLADTAAMRRLFLSDQPDLVIHCAALSKSPACQANPSLARELNVTVTARLAELANEIPFLFLSTDLVFDGRKGNYLETDPVNPLSVYAETKVQAEQIVLRNPRHTVVRTSLNGGRSPSGDRGFNEEMCLTWKAGRTLNLFTDEFRCPIAARVTADALWALARANPSGIFHLAGSERLSRWQVGELLAQRHRELNPRLHPGSLRDYQGAPRPPDTSLDSSRIQALLPFPLPAFSRWLAEHPEEPF